MKKMLSIILTIVLVLGSFSVTYAEPAVTGAGSFSDLGQDWYTDAIQNAVSNGLITGYQDGTVRPNGNLTRAELATILNRAFGATKQASLSGIKDVAAGDWYAVEMAKAIQMGTFKGGTDGRMRPGDPITRQEAFAVVARAYKLSSQEYSKLNQYADAASVDTWAKAEIAALINEGYIKGSDNKLNSKSKITRAEFATILGNLTKQYIKTAGPVTSVAERGNVLVNVDGVTLKNVTVDGDLIVGDGVGEGNLYLDNVKITGRTLVRGGGVNSVIIVGQAADVGKVIIAKVDGAVRVKAEGGAVIETIVIDDGKDDVIIEGTVGTVEVAAANVPVVIQNATITTVNVVAEKADVTIAKDTTVNTVTVAQTAADTSLAVAGTVATVTTQSSNTEIAVTGTVTKVEATATAQAPAISVAEGAKIENVITAAPETVVSGQGTVTKVEAQAGANGSSITTPNTQTTVAEGVTGATGGGGAAIESGTTTTNNATGTGSSETPATTGGGGGGGDNGPTTIAVTGITLNTATLILEINTPGAITTTGTITATVSPGNASNKNITWSSNNTSIAAVDSKGNVTAGTTTGTAIIKATTADGSKEASCTVTVAKDWSELADTSWYTNQASYTINNAQQLAGFAKLVNEGNTFSGITVSLGNNINLLDIKWISIGGNWSTTDQANPDKPFRGTFDGNNKTISNLLVTNPGVDYTGLFGAVNGTIKNLTLDTANVLGQDYVGAIVGNINGSIENITVRNANTSGNHFVGGVAGLIQGPGSSVSQFITLKNAKVEDSTITGLYNTTKNDDGDKVGGIAGYMRYARIEEVIADTLTVSGYRDVGGIVGAGATDSKYAIIGAFVRNSTIEAEKAGNLAHSSPYVGTIIGRPDGSGSNVFYLFDFEVSSTSAISYSEGFSGNPYSTSKFSTPILPAVMNYNQITSSSTIQAAINAATSGDTILVAEGTYDVGTININLEGLTLKSSGDRTKSTIQANEIGLSANHITIDGFTIDGKDQLIKVKHSSEDFLKT